MIVSTINGLRQLYNNHLANSQVVISLTLEQAQAIHAYPQEFMSTSYAECSARDCNIHEGDYVIVNFTEPPSQTLLELWHWDKGAPKEQYNGDLENICFLVNEVCHARGVRIANYDYTDDTYFDEDVDIWYPWQALDVVDPDDFYD